MVILASVVFGALLGYGTAQRRGGNRLDRLHYMAGFAIAFGILGVFVAIFVGRMA